jgi:hypothetical protein
VRNRIHYSQQSSSPISMVAVSPGTSRGRSDLIGRWK